jgi:hypothetical protein
MRCSWGERRMNTWTCVDNHAGKPPEKGERRGIHSDIYFGVLSDIRCAFLSGIWSDIYLAFYLAFYLTFIPTCHLAFYLAFSVPVWLTYILAYSGVPFAIHSDIQHLTFFLWHSFSNFMWHFIWQGLRLRAQGSGELGPAIWDVSLKSRDPHRAGGKTCIGQAMFWLHPCKGSSLIVVTHWFVPFLSWKRSHPCDFLWVAMSQLFLTSCYNLKLARFRMCKSQLLRGWPWRCSAWSMLYSL